MSVNWEELNRQYYNELSKTDKWRYENVYEDEYRKLFYELIQPKPSTKILDLGCGNGFYYQWLRTISDAYA